MLRGGAQGAGDEYVDVLLQACGFAKKALQLKERPQSCAKKLPLLCGNPRESWLRSPLNASLVP